MSSQARQKTLRQVLFQTSQEKKKKKRYPHPHTSISQVGGLDFQPFMAITRHLNSQAGIIRESQGGIWGRVMRHPLSPQSEKSPHGEPGLVPPVGSNDATFSYWVVSVGAWWRDRTFTIILSQLYPPKVGVTICSKLQWWLPTVSLTTPVKRGEIFPPPLESGWVCDQQHDMQMRVGDFWAQAV